MEVRKRIGILTGGGDCPGLNAAIRGAAKTAFLMGYEVIGIRDGWEGLLEHKTEPLDNARASGIIDRGGTILGASRTSPLRVENGLKRVMETFNELELEALVVLGGDGTLSATTKLFEMGLPVVGIPKTIDNDVAETDFAIGFQTAVQIATDAMDRLRSTAASHHRVMILEVMGNRTGWIATFAGLSGGADAILIPEIPVNEEKIDTLIEMLRERNNKGIRFSLIVVAEGTVLAGNLLLRDPHQEGDIGKSPKLGGAGQILAGMIEKGTRLETRVSSLGYIQRGGTPVAFDRILATSFGVAAMELIKHRKYGQMTALKGNKVVGVPLAEVAGRLKTVDLSVYRTAEIFFG